MKKKIIVLIILIIALIIFLVVGYNTLNGDENAIINSFKSVKYDEYSVGDKVSFNDEEWYVMYDSSSSDDYLTVISSTIYYYGEEGIEIVVDGIYETSDINEYLKNDVANELGSDNLVERNGYKIRLFNKDDFDSLITAEYDEENDEYTIIDCPSFICLTNTYYATMIDTNNDVEFVDTYYNVSDIDDLMYDDYVLHLKYYNITTTYETYRMNSLVSDATLIVRPVINVYKNSLD